MLELSEYERYLRCPDCQAAFGRDGEKLVCGAGHAFEISDGRPILLNEQDRKRFTQAVDASERMQREFQNTVTARIVSWVKLLIGSTLTLPFNENVKRIIGLHQTELSLEVGSGAQEVGGKSITLDIDAFTHVNVLGSITNIPFADETFTLVRNIYVLEHVDDPHKAVDEMHRVLKPGGYVVAQTPFMLHFHGYPNDFERYTVEGLKQLYHQFEVIETGVVVGPGSTITTLVADWFEMLTFTDRRIVNDVVRLIPLILLFPLKFLDFLLVKNPRSHEIAQCLYIVCRKHPTS